MSGRCGEDAAPKVVPDELVREALFLLSNVPWGSYQSWSRDGNTQAANALEAWDERRNDLIRRLLKVPEFGRDAR